MILINLIKSEKTEKRFAFSYSMILAIIIVIELAIFTTAYFYQHSTLNSLTIRRNSLKHVAAIVKKFNNQAKIIKEKSNSIKKLGSMRYDDISFMNRFGNSTVPNVWITSLSKNGSVTVAGKAFSYSSVARYMITLSKKGKFRDVNFEGKGLSRSGGTPLNPIVSFKIRFK